jgi:hypothetical protein
LAGLGLGVLAAVQPASAQGLFDALFGGGFRRAPAYLPPQATSYADPFGGYERERRAPAADYGGGPSMTYCVRLCDGRFFPLPRHAGASPAELCHSFCPASKTMVFSGSKIDYARAANGTRYADLDKAFVYRDRVVENCTCNGKDGLGLARLNSESDPTLRPGDIVATNDGLATFHGRNSKTAEFTPIKASSGDWAKRLSAIKVTPVRQTAAPVVAAAADDPPVRKDRRRVQLDR